MKDAESNRNRSNKIPLPVQTFLWRQTDPFVRLKLKDLSASCVTFEQVLVENKVQNLPYPALSGAIASISRWQFISASFPHVMHCAALLVANRNALGHGDRFGVAPIRLLKTLHWMLLKSPRVCGIEDQNSHYNISMENIRLFIFLFAPIVNNIKESDLTFSLEGGQPIWNPLRNFEQPSVAPFVTTITSSQPETSESLPNCTSYFKLREPDIKPIQVTVCDVAVISCLLYRRWSEEGVLWGMTYILKKLKACSRQNKEENDPIKASFRRCRSLMTRRKSGLLRSIQVLPVQKETGKECKDEDNEKESKKLMEIISDPTINRKLAPFHRFRQFSYQDRKKQKRKSPIAKRKFRKGRFGTMSFNKLKAPSTRVMAKHFSCRRPFQIKADDPPSYNAATLGEFSSEPKSTSKRKWFSYRKSALPFPLSVPEEDTPAPPPVYRKSFDVDSEDTIEIAYSCVSAVTPDAAELSVRDSLLENEDKENIDEALLSKKRRWTSDTCLTYKFPEDEPASMASCKYIDSDGCLRIDVVLSVVDVVVRKSSGLKLLDICIQVLVCLNERNIAYGEQQKQSKKQEVKSDKLEKDSTAEMFLEILNKLSRILGCTNACFRSGHRNTAASNMKFMIQHLITSVFGRHQALFTRYIENAIQTHSLQDNMDFLHSLLSYCVVEATSVAVKDVTDDSLCADNASNSELEHVVVKSIFLPLVKKCIQFGENLYKPSNQDLYREVRNLVQYVRLNHASTFNWTLLSVMLVPQHKREAWETELAEEGKKSDEVAGKRDELLDSFPPDCYKNRRGAMEFESSPLKSPKGVDRNGKPIIRKPKDIFEKGMSTTEGHYVSSSRKHTSLEQDFSDDEETDRGRNHRDKTSSPFEKMGNLLKRASVIPNFNKAGDNMDGEDSDECENGNSNFFSKIIKKKNTKRLNRGSLGLAFQLPIVPLIELADQRSSAKRKTVFEVEEDDIVEGINILRFLMECCPPGTVPDANILGSVMGLTSPIISRFAVIIQCAEFVERCVGDKWPRWINDRPSQSHRSVKEAKELYYLTARTQFMRWGTEINKFLEKLISLNNNPNILLGEISSHEEKLKHREEDLNEDFLKDILVNKSGKVCPVSLQMAAANLLYQITAFLRETTFELVCRKESFFSNTEIASKSEVGTSATSPARIEDSSPKKTIKFFEPSESTTSLGASSLKRAMSLVNEHRPSEQDKNTGSERRSSSSTCVASDERPLAKTQNPRSGRKSSGNVTSNMLTVPGTLGCHGDCLYFNSLDICYGGSTVSLGATSVTSEYIHSNKDSNDASQSPYASSLMIDCIARGRDLPWIKTIMSLVNQQNFLCDHVYNCHPFCYKRMLRSCDRMVATLSDILSKYEVTKMVHSDSDTEHLKSPSLYMYLKNEGSCLSRSPLMVLLKSVTIISCEMLIDLHALCWEILLDNNKLLVESAAALFLLCAIKIKRDVCNSLINELKHPEPALRINALKKLRVLWEYRNSVWKNAESSARDNKDTGFTFPAANTTFALSLSTMGLETTPLPDPPWIPHIIDVDQIVAQRGSSSQSAAILATDTLSHHREQELKQLIRQEEEERADSRRNFHITNAPVIQLITAEAKKKTDSETDCEHSCEIRRYSSRPAQNGSSSSNADSRRDDNRSIRSSIIHGLRSSHQETAGIDNSSRPNSCVFPPAIGDCIPTVIQALSDVAMNEDGESVSSVAMCVVTSCLNEDSNLFLRSIGERLVCQEEKDEGRSKALCILRKLPTYLPDLSPSVSHSLFLQIVESVIHYNRISPVSEPIVIPSTFAFCSIMPFCRPFDFKIMKQMLRKQQIEIQLLVTAGMQGTKQLSVWSEDYPCNFPYPIQVTDNSTFEFVLAEGARSLEIPESKRHLQQMEDPNSSLILCHHCYVRDFYPFKKNVTPQIAFVPLEREEAVERLSRRVAQMKQAEIGRLRLTLNGLRSHHNAIDKELNATFVENEFSKLWSFPRKAIDAEFYLFSSEYGNEIRNLDAIQKYYWIELISEIFLSLSSEFSWDNNLVFFLHVWSAALVIHCEQAPVLRACAAAIINGLAHFSHTFTLHGYNLVLPSMLKVYSKHCYNKTIRSCLDLVFFQMFNVHRQPFLLQLFASAAPLLSAYNLHVAFGKWEKDDHMSPESFFCLLLSLAKPDFVDELHVMSFVHAETLLKPADTCLETEDPSVAFGDYFRLCITVIAYQSENSRTLEMLVVLNSVLPCYLQHIQKTSKPCEELAQISELGVYIRALLVSVEAFTKTITSSTSSQQQPPTQTSSHSQVGEKYRSNINGSTKSNECTMEAGRDKEEAGEKRQPTEDFVAPRDAILQLCSVFYTTACSRMHLLKGSQPEDLFNIKCHFRLAEIAQSLLKVICLQQLLLRIEKLPLL